MFADHQKQKFEAFVSGMVLGCTFGVLMTVFLAYFNAEHFKKKCVENGAAHYDSKTGAFTWKNEVTK